MNAFAWIVGVSLVVTFAAAGITKLVDLDRARERFGYSRRQYQVIGLAEVAAAVAIVVGLMWTKLEWVALAGAVGLCALMLGALITHARVGDEARAIAPAAGLFVLAALFLVVVSLR